MSESFRILHITRDGLMSAEAADDAGFGPFQRESCAPEKALAMLTSERFSALVVACEWEPWPRAAVDCPVLLVQDDADGPAAVEALRAGAQDVLATHELALPSWPRRLRAAIERHRLLVSTRRAYATDVLTGLPHERQLVEHMSHLLALREREPSPMALLVLRVEGLSTTEARLGREAASVLRRKLAVRLRSGVRSSDVVASLSGDSFAVLLSALESVADADAVGRKLMAALNDTFRVGGQDVAVAAALGVARHPADGTQPEALLQRAVGLAASAQAVGRAGHANWLEQGGEAPTAANE